MSDYLEPEDLMPTDEELELMKRAQEAQGTGSAIGGTVGGLAGAGLSLIPGAQPFAPIIIPAATTIGGAIGSGIGGWFSDEAQKELEALQEARGEKQSDFDLREEALARLLGTR